MYKIPISGENESFTISILGNNYKIQLQWRDIPFNSWGFSIGNESGWLLQGVSVVFGIDLIKPLSFMNLGFKIVLGCNGKNTGLNQNNFGTTYGLYVIEND